MPEIQLYGIPGSRALRSIWAIEEVGAPYELVATNFAGESKSSDFLAVNPNGRIPAMVDGDVTLFESMAINLYLAKKYGGSLYPSGDDEARAIQWSFWGMTELEPPLMQLVMHRAMLPEGERSTGAAAAAEAALDRPLAVLDKHLAHQDHLLGAEFSIADLNVASVLSMSAFVQFDFSSYANVQRWAGACLGRPSFARAQKAGA